MSLFEWYTDRGEVPAPPGRVKTRPQKIGDLSSIGARWVSPLYCPLRLELVAKFLKAGDGGSCLNEDRVLKTQTTYVCGIKEYAF